MLPGLPRATFGTLPAVWPPGPQVMQLTEERLRAPKRCLPVQRRRVGLRAAPEAASGTSGKLAPVLVISCLNLMGFTVVTPIMPGLMGHFKLSSAASVGYMSSAFALGRFCTTSMWPIASDFFGRKRILAIALLGGALGSAMQGVAISLRSSFALFLLARGLSGMFSGIVPVMKAYISDSFESDQIPKVLAYREAAGTFAFVIGPFLGGALASEMFALPLFFSAATGIAAALLALYGLPDVVQSSKPGASAKSGETSAEATAGEDGKSFWALLPLLLLSFTWACTRTCFHTYFPLMAASRYHLSVARMGVLLTSVSLLIACLQVGAFDFFRRRLGLRGTLATGGVLVSSALLGLGVGVESSPLPVFLACSAAYAAGVALITPALPALLLQAAPQKRRGTFLGVESVVVNFGRIVAPPLFGMLLYSGALPLSAVATALSTSFVWWHSGRRVRKRNVST